jgi:hypothetical protein
MARTTRRKAVARATLRDDEVEMTRHAAAAYFRERGFPNTTYGVIRAMVASGALRAYQRPAQTSGRLYHVRILKSDADKVIEQLQQRVPVRATDARAASAAIDRLRSRNEVRVTA